MQTRFFTPAEVVDYFEQGELREDLLDGEIIAVCSIADFLDVCEAYKKDAISVSSVQGLLERSNAFAEGPVKEGAIYIADLDRDCLSSALFEHEGGIVTDLWRMAANRNISPKRSTRYLTLRIIDDSTWWSENVYQEMEEYHLTQDG